MNHFQTIAPEEDPSPLGYFLGLRNDVHVSISAFKSNWLSLGSHIETLKPFQIAGILQHAAQGMHGLSREKDCSDYISSLATTPTMTGLIQRASKLPDQTAPGDMANLIWGFANLSIHPGHAFLRKFEEVAERKMADFSSRNINLMAASLASLAHLPGASFLDRWSARRIEIPCDTPEHCTNPLWAATAFSAIGAKGLRGLAEHLSATMSADTAALRLNDIRTLNTAAKWFGFPSPGLAHPAETATHTILEKRLSKKFAQAGANILPEAKNFLPEMNHSVDFRMTYRNRDLIVEADGMFHFLTMAGSGRKELNGRTLLQTALMQKLFPDKRILRIPANLENLIDRSRGYRDLLRDFSDSAPGAYIVATGQIGVRLGPIPTASGHRNFD